MAQRKLKRKDEEINMKKDKCPTCGCAEITIDTYYGEDDLDYVVEKKVKCKDCGRIKYHRWRVEVYVDNWKEKKGGWYK